MGRLGNRCGHLAPVLLGVGISAHGAGKGCLVDKREADHDSREAGFSPDGAEDLRTKCPPPALVPTRPWEGCVNPGLSRQIEATPRPQPHLVHISRS